MIAKKQIKIVTINSETEAVESKDLWCPTCNTIVAERNQVYGYCSYCKEEHLISELFIPQSTGGVYCQLHVTEFFSNESKRTLDSIVSKIS